MSSENVERIRKQSEETDLSYINESIVKLSQTLSDAKWSTQPRILLELCIVKLATNQTGFASIPVQGYVKTAETQPSESEPPKKKLKYWNRRLITTSQKIRKNQQNTANILLITTGSGT